MKLFKASAKLTVADRSNKPTLWSSVLFFCNAWLHEARGPLTAEFTST